MSHLEIVPLLLEIKHWRSCVFDCLDSWKSWQGCSSFVSIFSNIDFRRLVGFLDARGLMLGRSGSRESGIAASAGHVR